MRTTILVVILLMSAIHVIGGEFIHQDRSWYSHFTNKVCEFKVKDAEVVKTPTWTEDYEFPPFSARRAVWLAKAKLAPIVNTPAEWTIDRVSLEPWDDENHWIYIVTFRHQTTSHGDGTMFDTRLISVDIRPALISIPVLLSGIAVQPTVSPPK